MSILLRKTKLILFTLLILLTIIMFPKKETKHMELVYDGSGATAGTAKAVYNNYVTAVSIPVEANEVDVVGKETPNYTSMEVPSDSEFKSYMSYKAISDKNSAQYKLISEYEDTECGIMAVDGRYVVAVGTYYTDEVGTKIDLVMENGETVGAIVGDIKANQHTDAKNQQHKVDGSVVEFLVDTSNLEPTAKRMGDCSYATPELEGKIEEIRVYTEE